MADVRAMKSGLALEAQQKIHGKYDEELAKQIIGVSLGFTRFPSRFVLQFAVSSMNESFYSTVLCSSI